MVFYFGNNPIEKFKTKLINKYEDRTQKIWLSKPHYIQCKLCGDKMRSDKDIYSPEQCGWKKLKVKKFGGRNWGWICHSCDGHFYEHWERRDNTKWI